MSKKPIALIIMDGFGYNHKDYGNAIRAAKTPNIDRLLANYPHTLIGASGMDVGLPEGQMGNSEVGHTNIGAGRIVYQELTRITKSIKDGEFFSNEAFTAAVENCKKNRDNRWERVGKAYDAMVYGEGNKADNAVDAIKASYAADVTDEFVVPTVIDENGKISANDSVIFFNFRPDRAREITRTLVDDDFTGFERRKGRFPLYYVCMTQYDATMPNVDVAFKPASLENTFGEYIAKKGLSQLRIAETEKYAHVTFFFNGGVEAPFENEDRALINSPKVATYDLQPEMSAYLVCDEVLKRIESDKYDAIILNYANCDMVGHTGVFDAAVAAVEAVDECVGKTVDAVLAKGGIALITADHGNADKMMEDDGSPFTAHTTNLVPLIIAGAGNVLIREGGVLADLSPTMLKLMGLEQPKEMTGKSIIKD